MNKKPLVLISMVLALGALEAQDLAKPLSESALLKSLDSFPAGDPLLKGPLSLGDAKPAAAARDTDASREEKKTKGPTEITALDADFDNRSHRAIFLNEVVVKDPEFNVVCDKLTAYLKHDDKPLAGTVPGAGKASGKPPVKAPAATPPPAAGAAGAPADKPSKGGGLEKALAEMKGDGRVLITQDKVDADGKVSHSVGHAKKALYDAITGDITLTGTPNVQQGLNMCMALEESTVMVLNREGRMRVTGPHKTVIQDAGADAAPAGGAPRKTSAPREATPQPLNISR